MKKQFLILSITLMIVFSLNIISAQRYINNDFKYGEIDPNGNLVTTNTPINNVNTIGFVCSSNRCATVSSRLWPGVLTSTNSLIQLIYPTTLQSSYGYGVYEYKEGYIPYGVAANWYGTTSADPMGPFDNYLTKKQVCSSLILSLSATESGNNINVETTLRAPISKAGLLDYIPSEIASQFASDNKITVELKKDNTLIYTESKTINMPFSSNQTLDFSFTKPTAPGTYTIRVYTNPLEPRCINPMQEEKQTTIILTSVCSTDCQCGTNIFTGNPSCQNNNVFQNFINYHCNNPGQTNSFCSSSTNSQLKQDCGTSSCGCYGANYCKNNNVYHSRTCNDKGCSNGACTSSTRTEEQLVQTCTDGCSNGQCIIPPITCSKNSDCGTDILGNAFCQNNNVFQNLTRKICVNPGQTNSFCTTSIISQLFQDCAAGTSSCTNFGTNYCIGNSVYHSRTCNNKGCNNGACTSSSTTDEQLIQTCCPVQTCSNGQCINPPTPVINCSSNLDCGTDMLSSNFCQNNNVFQNLTRKICVNPGQTNSFCTTSIISQLFQDCAAGSSCESPGDDYCKGDDVYYNQTCYNNGCSTTNLTNSACFNTASTNQIFVETCSHGCNNGKCKSSGVIRRINNTDDSDNNPNTNVYNNNYQQDFSYIKVTSANSKINTTNAAIKIGSDLQSSGNTSKTYSNLWIIILIVLIIVSLIILILLLIALFSSDKKRKVRRK
jgi:hypothetical protein